VLKKTVAVISSGGRLLAKKKYVTHQELLAKRLKDPVFRKVYEERSADKLKVLLNRIRSSFGDPLVECTAGGRWRVSARGVHIHFRQDGSFSCFEAYGNTPQEAAKNLLELAVKHLVFSGNHCGDVCPRYYLDVY
jgi:hypothetical protein